jgi:uncharacterized protein YukE
MSAALVRPGGDPDQIVLCAAELSKAGGSTGDVATGIHRQTARVREEARWAGAAADGFTSFASGLSRAVGALEPPLRRVSAPLRDFADALRNAQQRVDSYSTAYDSSYPLRPSSGSLSPVPGQDFPVIDSELVALYQDAQVAVAACHAQAGVTSARLRQIAAEMTRDFFGPEGPFRDFLDKSHLPWDAVAGDAVIESFIKGGEAAENALDDKANLGETIDKLQEEIVTPVVEQIEAGSADAHTNLKLMLRTLDDYQVQKDETVAKVMKALADTNPGLAENLSGLKTVAAGAGLIGFLGGIYAMASPPKEDHGLWHLGDRVAGFGASAGSATGIAEHAFDVNFGELSLGPFESLEVVPDVGIVIAVAGGIYMTVDWVVHHPQEAHYILDHPQVAACNLLGNMFGKQIWRQAGCAPAPPSI